MSYPQHWLLVLGGDWTTAGSTGEIWECGIRGAPAAGSTLTYGDEDAALSAIQAAVSSWFSGASNQMRNDARLKYIKLNEIGPDGKYADAGNTHQYDYATPVAGGAGPSFPGILTVAWSWTTAKARGLAHTGRIYPPCAMGLNTGALTLTSASQTAHLASAKALLNAISNPGASGTFVMGPQVVSNGGKSGVGTREDITGIRIGNVVDVQRRRKNAVKETYATTSWP